MPAEAIVIGASAGALEALSVILPGLPADLPAAILIVVHLPADRPCLLADLLGAKCAIAVREAEDKEPIRPGTAYLAPPDYHILVERDRRLSLSSDEPVNFSRPAIDVLFESAADVYGPGLVGVVLTGANSDGAAGLLAIANAGGLAVVQRPGEAHSPTMPAAAQAACPAARALSLGEIAGFLLSVAGRG